MFAYHLALALRSLRRNVVITALIVVAISVGIGASMTMLTTLVAMSANPIPDKSSVLFTPQLDVFSAASHRANNAYNLPVELTYRDAMALQSAHRGIRQAAMYAVALTVSPPDGDAFVARGRATYRDFFALFEVPFRSGASWGGTEDQGRANVVVLSARLSERLFQHTNPIGRTINLDDRGYRVVGVVRPWTPVPRFYDIGSGIFNDSEDFYLPFSTAIDRQMRTSGADDCSEVPPASWEGHLNSNCTWTQLWVELPTRASVTDFRNYLSAYAVTQKEQGRFAWTPAVDLHDVMDWMAYEHIVSNQVRANVWISLGFLAVCLINAVGLMLAMFSRRAPELGLRRALGASRQELFLHGLAETLVIGFIGGALGMALTAIGLSGLRGLLEIAKTDVASIRLVSLDSRMVLITMAVALVATVCAGLYPTLRASRVQPAWQMKAE